MAQRGKSVVGSRQWCRGESALVLVEARTAGRDLTIADLAQTFREQGGRLTADARSYHTYSRGALPSSTSV
jgi:hypothetical protein